MQSTKLPYDVIMFALPRWDGQYSSTAFSLAQALSQHTRVFYIDNPFTWKDFLLNGKSKQIQRRRDALMGSGSPFSKPIAGNDNLIVVTPQLVLPINWMPTGRIYAAFSKRNERVVYKVLSKLISTYNVERFVFVNSFNPLFLSRLSDEVRPLLTVYHCVDDISKSDYIAKHGTRLEREAIKHADLTLVTSRELKRVKERESKRVYYLPNAANVELFRQAFDGNTSRPAELKQIPPKQKIILYMGNICQRLDYDLLVKLARAHSDKTLVMVGPQTNPGYRTSGLSSLSNVLFTGPKDLTELPAFVAASACCIIPFLCIPLTKSIYPLKINEYLAGGKPVVTTNFSEDIATFAGVAKVSENHDEFISGVSDEINNDSPGKAKERVEYAAANNWNTRALQMLEIFEENINNR